MDCSLVTAQKSELIRQVADDLHDDEGYRFYAYPDPLSPLFKKYRGLRWGFQPARELLSLVKDMSPDKGKPWTVGYGFTHRVTPDSTMSMDAAKRKLEEEILEIDCTLESRIPWYKEEASFVTKTVLINMAFNMGIQGLLKFRNTLRYVKEHNYNQAASNMMKSLWSRQVPRRAKYLSKRMGTQTIEK